MTKENVLSIKRHEGNGLEVGMVIDPKDWLRGANAVLVEEKTMSMKDNIELKHTLRKTTGLGDKGV